jgi:NAD(P)-dependent dehydrogenase (short-subunit alcohol dehydrogenase family)
MLSFDDLKGKVCVITGGAGVIGTAIAKDLVKLGVKVAILDRNEENAHKVAKQLENDCACGGTVRGYQADVLDKALLILAKQKINNELGSIDLLINGGVEIHPKQPLRSKKWAKYT